jgi:large subunit ribosomal protein L23
MGILDKFTKKADKAAAPKATKAPAGKKVASKPAAKPVVKAMEGDGKELKHHGILLGPVMTEKSLKLESEQKFVFYVAHHANKHQVMMAVKEQFGVEPLAVRMITIPASTMMRWGREQGTYKKIKKAIVSVPEGASLKLTA